MPGAARLRDELENASVLQDEVVCRDFRSRIAELADGSFGVARARVVQDDHVRHHAVLALAVIG